MSRAGDWSLPRGRTRVVLPYAVWISSVTCWDHKCRPTWESLSLLLALQMKSHPTFQHFFFLRWIYLFFIFILFLSEPLWLNFSFQHGYTFGKCWSCRLNVSLWSYTKHVGCTKIYGMLFSYFGFFRIIIKITWCDINVQ